LLHSTVLKAGESPKFHYNWRGPYLALSKSNNGLLYRLRHCSTGKEPRAVVHANRLKVYHDDRDAFYLRHNIKPKDVATTTSQHSSDSAKTTDDTWYPIDKLLDHKRVGKRLIFLSNGWTHRVPNPGNQTTI